MFASPLRLAALVALLAAVPGCRPSAQAAPGAPAAPAADVPAAGRAPLSKKAWTRPPAEELQKRLTPIQLKVTQESGTEPPFRNEYWDNHAPGLYVDVVTGEPLFSSLDKFDSGTGWPSFVRPLEQSRVVNKSDGTHGMVRTEVRSAAGDSHLGHLFDDGPAPTGQRYCINSAALRFIPVERLEAEGYGEYAQLFAKLK